MLGLRIQHADWWFQFSHDVYVRLAGVTESLAIHCAIEQLARQNLELARDLWFRHAPSEVKPPACLGQPSPPLVQLGVAA